MTTHSLELNLDGQEKEFFRLLGFSLPVPKLYAHYLNMMSQYDKGIIDKVKDFNVYAKWVSDMGYGSCQKYRIEHAAKAFDSWVKANDVLKNIDYTPQEFKQKDLRRSFVQRLPIVQGRSSFGENTMMDGGCPLFSVDMAEANYSVMKMGAKQKGVSLPQRWSEFCDKVLRIHPFLAESKVFRQHCIGSYNAKVCMSVQKSFIQLLVDKFDLYERAVLISPDEIVVPYDNESSAQLHRDIYYDFIPNSIYDGAMGVKTTLYEMYAIGNGEDGMIKISYDTAKSIEKSRKLFDVSGNKHYMYFRRYILGQELEENDILFVNDGMMAKWVI